MNAERRKEIARAVEMVEEAKLIVERCRDEEQEYYENMPEAFKDGEKGDRAQEVISALEAALSDLENIDLDDAMA